MLKKLWNKGLDRVIFLLVAAALVAVGIFVGQWSFAKVHHMRQLERVPEVPVEAVISGEVNLSGDIEQAERILSSPDTNTPSVYYRYHVEKKTTDSDGNTKWETVKNVTKSVDFYLRDDTDKIRIHPSKSVEFNVERDSRRTQGSMRYSEYRLEPGSSVFVFGYAELVDDAYQVGFERDGSYQPIISERSDLGERRSMARWSAAGIVGALAAFSFAMIFLLGVFRIHHSAVYLVAVSTVMIGALVYQGVSMMKADLRDADLRAERALEEGAEVINRSLNAQGVEWDGDWDNLGDFDEGRLAQLPIDTRSRLSRIRVALAQAAERTNDNLSRFPESLLGPVWGFKPRQAPPLSPSERDTLAALEQDFAPTRLGVLTALIAILLGGLLAFLLSRMGLETVSTKRTIENVPTSPIEGVAYGLTEIKGTAELDAQQPSLSAPLSMEQCVYYHYVVKKKTGGKNKKWKTITDETRSVPFVCRDDTDSIFVDQEGARFMAADSTSKRSGNKKYIEHRIRPGEDLYILGSAEIDTHTYESLEIAQGEDDLPYIIASYSEDEVMYKEARSAFYLLNVGLLATITFGLGVAGTVVSFGPMLYTATAGFACAYLFVMLFFLYYNDLVFLRERFKRNWANIDVALKKRFDLITSLANTVQGYLDHESDLQEALARARSGHDAGETDPDDDTLTADQQARDHVLATVEAHPNLKGAEMVDELMHSLTEVENEIALMRDGYNDAVERYNSRTQKFPELFIAKMFGFEKASHFRVYGEETEAPEIGRLRN